MRDFLVKLIHKVSNTEFSGRIFSLTSFLLFLSTSLLYSQTEKDIKAIMSEPDQKKYERAENYKTDGDKLTDEANQLYLKTFEVQGNYDLDEKTVQKKVDQLESKAADKQFDAAIDYQKAVETKYKLLKEYSKKFWDSYSGDKNKYNNARLIEEQAADFYYKAGTKISDAKRIKDNKKRLTALNEANDLGNQAIEKMVTALGFYYELTPTNAATPVDNITAEGDGQNESQNVNTTAVPAEQQNVSSLSPGSVNTPDTSVESSVISGDKVQINNEQVEMYRNYINNNNIPPPVVINRNGVGNVNNFNAEKLTELWDKYKNDSLPPESAGTTSVPDTANYELSDVDSTAPVITAGISGNTSQEKTGKPSLQRIDTVESEISGTQLVPANEKVIYRVQLAVNKSELPQQALQQIYHGNKQVEMINEDGWFKYSVGDFDTYDAASQFKNKSGVKDAFVVAYRQGTDFQTVKNEKNTRTKAGTSKPVTAVPVASGVSSEEMIFRVQVAASRTPLTKDQLASIYKGNCTLEMISEEGWFKYQIGDFRLYNDASRTRQASRVKGAFIVAYNNGEKMKLADAVQQIKPLEKEVKNYGRQGKIKDIDFYVQIAASKIPLSSVSISQVYSGELPVVPVIEEDWYKYQLKAGTDYETAKQLMAQCNVKNAFIVAYKFGRKIPLYQAIRESKY